MIFMKYPANESNLQARSREHTELRGAKPTSKSGTGARASNVRRNKLLSWRGAQSKRDSHTERRNANMHINDLTQKQRLAVPCPACAAVPQERCCEISSGAFRQEEHLARVLAA